MVYDYEIFRASDFLAFKCLSKRCFTMTFFNQRRFRYFRHFAKQLVDSNLYYSTSSFFVRKLLQNVKDDTDLSNWLFLNYFLDNLKTDLIISNCFCHLFHCPRSLFAKSQCILCSRKYVLTLITKSKNFEELFKFDFGDKLLIDYKEISFQGFKSSLFYKSFDELATIMSDRKRCLTTCVVYTPSKFARLFLEVFLRILMNYCYKFVELQPESQEVKFLEKYIIGVIEFLSNILPKFKFSVFVNMFSQNSFNSNIFKLINENFINYCSKKYACEV